jgi:hypothetical protein
MKKLYKRLKEGRTNLALDNAKDLSNQSGMVGPGSKMTKTNKRTINSKMAGCPHCGLESHRRITSKNMSHNSAITSSSFWPHQKWTVQFLVNRNPQINHRLISNMRFVPIYFRSK